MRRRNRMAWKLSVVVLVIVSLVILGTGLLGNFLSNQYALDAARGVIRFNSVSLYSGIDELMMSRNCAGALEFLEKMSRGSTTYKDISLISHPSGRIAVSRLREPGEQLDISDKSCNLCHVTRDQVIVSTETLDEVITDPGGNRFLQVITPILSKPDCQTADCHTRDESGSVLGLLRTQYSLASFDDLMTDLSLFLVLAAVIAILLAVCALLMMFRWFLAKPIRSLVTGVEALAEGDLGFRFKTRRNDEIGLVEDSFNNMASQIQTHQTELRRSLEYLEGIVENTADLIISVNTEGYIQTFNRGAELALGYDREEVIGRRIERLFADPQERNEAIARLRGTDNVANWRTRFKTKDGQIRYLLLTLSRLRDRKGNVLGTLGISKDITTERDLQQKLIRSEQEAAIGRAVTAIQHAIKNMLNTLRGGLYVVQVGYKKSQQERITEGCEMIQEGLTRINDLSTNMLKYAREWKIEPEPVNLAQMAEDIVSAVSQTANERGVSVRTEVTDSLPSVSCDPRLIHMGLMDLVSNALDACDLKDYGEGEDSKIVIRVYRSTDGESAVVEVEDNGVGMTREVRENVFTPFFSTKQKWGTGLGLALTSRIIILHDGKITVESEPEKGAVFRVTLPLKGPRKKPGDE